MIRYAWQWYWHRRVHKLAARELLAREVRAEFASAGGRAAARKAREPFREKARQLARELGLPDDPRLA